MSGIIGKVTNRQVHNRQLISSSQYHSVSRQATTVMESSVLAHESPQASRDDLQDWIPVALAPCC
jgi:hypothetical protein